MQIDKNLLNCNPKLLHLSMKQLSDKLMPTDSSEKDRIREEVSVRICRLAFMEKLLCEFGGLSIDELHEKISFRFPVNSRTVRNDIKFFENIQENIVEDYDFKKWKEGNTWYYSVNPAKSLFRRNFSHSEIELLRDIISNLGQFGSVPGLENIHELETLFKSPRRVGCPIVDINIKSHPKRDLFAFLFNAIVHNCMIEIEYRKINDLESETTLRETILPFQIKRFGNRWVLIGAVKRNEFIVNFSFDQIISARLYLTGMSIEHFDGFKRMRVKGLFDNAIGPTMPKELCKLETAEGEDDIERLETVYIYAFPGRANHLMAFPIIDNDSQDELLPESPQYGELMSAHPELPEGGRIFMFECYTYRELKEAIMSRMDSVVVLAPESLRKDIAARISRLNLLYNV